MGDRVGDGREVQKGGLMCIPMAGSCWGLTGEGREVQKGGLMCIPIAGSCWGLTEHSKIL